MHLDPIRDDELNHLVEIAFDLDQILNTLNNDIKKPNSERNFVQEDTYNSIYHVNIVYYHLYLFYEIIVFIFHLGTEKFYVPRVHSFT